MKPIGVIGGMGPEATILLMQKVLAAVDAKEDSDHIPLIVHQNPQVPSRIAALIDGRGADPGPVLAQMARDLKNAGACSLAMPCNTAHHYAPMIEKATDLPLLHMIELAAAELADRGAQRVGMLASPGTRRGNVFGTAFARQDITPIWTTDEEGMLALILAVKAGEQPEITGALLAQQAELLIEAGADHLLIACTELSLLSHYVPSPLQWTDSLDCLCAAIVSFAVT